VKANALSQRADHA
jgi:hypothetical protein